MQAAPKRIFHSKRFYTIAALIIIIVSTLLFYTISRQQDLDKYRNYDFISHYKDAIFSNFETNLIFHTKILHAPLRKKLSILFSNPDTVLKSTETWKNQKFHFKNIGGSS